VKVVKRVAKHLAPLKTSDLTEMNFRAASRGGVRCGELNENNNQS
jgi:hypothetical protein